MRLFRAVNMRELFEKMCCTSVLENSGFSRLFSKLVVCEKLWACFKEFMDFGL